MNGTLRLNINRLELIQAIKEMAKKERDTFIEDLLAATSPEYLESIKQARKEYTEGKTKKHTEVFGA